MTLRCLKYQQYKCATQQVLNRVPIAGVPKKKKTLQQRVTLSARCLLWQQRKYLFYMFLIGVV